jgi:kinesin family protein 5
MLNKNMGSICAEFKNGEAVTITSNTGPTSFTLDRIFNYNTSQKEVYEQVAKPTIEDVLKGYNGTIFTYGQSGSGKTYTMYGSNLYDDEGKGVIPRAIEDIFAYINSEQGEGIKFELKFSMLEIYKENLYDLLNPETKYTDLKIKEHPKKGIYVTNLTEAYIASEEEFILMIDNADDYRVVQETGLNKNSSRSHLLFQLEIIQKFPDDTEKKGILNLIDLAGSEKVNLIIIITLLGI